MNIKIGIIGLGYVGLPLALGFSKKYFVKAYDENIFRLLELKRGVDRNNEVKKKKLSNKNFNLTSKIRDLKECNIFIITVPTPINKKKIPDLTLIKRALRNVGKLLKKEDIVIIESTVYPGFTNEVAVPILEKISKLKYNKDFSCGYSPERINPGDNKHKLENIIKVVSGSNKKALIKIKKLYTSIIKVGIYPAESIEIAEAAKVIENTQRDLNIALMNELQIIFDRMKISTSKVIKAASTKWNFLNFQPGLVGGHCIGVDPYYLTYKSKKVGIKPKVILSGRSLNDNMGNYYSNKFLNSLMKLKKINKESKILIMGLSFKENCNDIRNSKVFDIISRVSKNYKVRVFDPNVKNKNLFKKNKNVQMISSIKKNSFDGIILTVKHKEFAKLGLIKIKSFGKKDCIFYDIKNLFFDNKEPIKINDFI